MKIHFICTGNSYRSRLAEAYLNSKQINGIEAFSSGTGIDKRNGPIGWPAERILQKTGLSLFMSPSSIQTTKKLLDSGDFTVFMDESHFKYAERLGFSAKNYEIWEIPDFSLEIIEDFKGYDRDIEFMKISENTFKVIKEKVDELVKKL